MKPKPLFFYVALCAFSGTAWPQDQGVTDQTEKTAYWNGAQLNNLSRLGGTFDGFENTVQKKRTGKEAESYLLEIRQDMAEKAKARDREKATIIDGKYDPQSALSVAYVQKDFIRVSVQAKLLFDENSASLKGGAMDVINRLAEILRSKEGQHVEVSIINEMDNIVNARDIGAERAQLLFGLLNFKRIAEDNSLAS